MTNKLYTIWSEKAILDADLATELNAISGKNEEIYDRFYRELEFGTGGLRGVIGAGTNRMNVYTVGRATQGFAQWVIDTCDEKSVAIAYDCRNKSDVFAKAAAEVFAANGIKVYIYKELMPTPMLSFAVRYLHCCAGVVVTASHNPAKYNGYKAYDKTGCQLNLEDSEAVLAQVANVDTFAGIKRVDFDEALKSGMISYIGDDVISAFLDAVQAQSVHPEVFASADMKLVYTPLHGSGNKPVRAILDRLNIKDVSVVAEQEEPNGNFPTVPFPNPEFREAFECALKLAETVKPDLLLATDPDSDRVGIAVLDEGEYKLMSGNQVGALIMNYLLEQRTENGTLPKKPIVIKTIVSTELCKKIAAKYSAELIEVLTGFKFIGEIVGNLEEKGEENRFVFGFEESYGYLAGSYVRDKDAVLGAMIICEMASFYKQQGKTLIQIMNDIYAEFGLYINEQLSFTCEGASGMEQINNIMKSLRKNPPKSIGGLDTIALSDYELSKSTDFASGTISEIKLPKSNVLTFKLTNDCTAIVRPSGTEPKIKVYVEARGENEANAKALAKEIGSDMSKLIGF